LKDLLADCSEFQELWQQYNAGKEETVKSSNG
jgi:hypothetical protein